MCGRYTLTVDGDAVFEAFDWLADPSELLETGETRRDALAAEGGEWNRPRFNVCPTQPVLAIGKRPQEAPNLAWFRWGLVPSFASDTRGAARRINARSETVATKPFFRGAFAQRRCLVLADGWYEWKAVEGAKRPFFVSSPGSEAPTGHGPRAIVTFAGIWERWRKEKGAPHMYSLAVLTQPARGSLTDLHPRMPVVVPATLRAAWLEARSPQSTLRDVLNVKPSNWDVREVGPRVGNARNDDPACLQG